MNLKKPCYCARVQGLILLKSILDLYIFLPTLYVTNIFKHSIFIAKELDNYKLYLNVFRNS